MTELATTGHNNPPTPIEEWAEAHSDLICEVNNWCDGDPVTDEAGMKSVDELAKDLRKARTDLKAAVEEYRRPFIDANTAAQKHAKVYTDDADLMQKKLAELVAPFKAKLAAEKEAAKRAAYEEAARIEREAKEAEAKAAAGDIDAARDAQAKKEAALDAKKAASAANKDTVKGLRTVHNYEITDHKAALHWIAKNDRDAITAFIEEYVRRNFKAVDIDGVDKTTTKEAY